MVVYKSPGFWIPTSKGYSTLMRKYKINNIFNLDREVFKDKFTHFISVQPNSSRL